MGFTSKELRAAIDRCNAECEAMIARHEPPERIEARRKGIDTLHRWLAHAEAEEKSSGRAYIRCDLTRDGTAKNGHDEKRKGSDTKRKGSALKRREKEMRRLERIGEGLDRLRSDWMRKGTAMAE